MMQRTLQGDLVLINRIYDLVQDQSKWSQATFGSDAERGPQGPLNHLAKEIDEAKQHPNDILEFADLQLLVWDAARRAGHTLPQLIAACEEKMKINRARTWPKVTDPTAAVEHVKEIADNELPSNLG